MIGSSHILIIGSSHLMWDPFWLRDSRCFSLFVVSVLRYSSITRASDASALAQDLPSCVRLTFDLNSFIVENAICSMISLHLQPAGLFTRYNSPTPRATHAPLICSCSKNGQATTPMQYPSPTSASQTSSRPSCLPRRLPHSRNRTEG